MGKIASKMVRSYKWLLACWIIFIGVMGYFAFQLPSLLEGDGFRTDGQYEQVEEELQQSFGFPKSTLLVLFENQSDEAMASIIKDINSLQIASSIQSPLDDDSMYGEDVAYAAVHVNDESLEMNDVISSVKAITDERDGVQLTGAPVISEDINKASQDDLKQAELIGLPIALLILLFALRTIVASILPLVVGAVTIIAGFGLLSIIGDAYSLSIFILNIAPMIGLALSIDFSLLFINRYKEEMQQSNKREALITTIQTAGRSILFSALCVFIGLVAMSVIQVDIFMNIAIGGAVVVVMAVLTSLTLLPALLYVIGDNIHKWSIIPIRNDTQTKWRTFARKVMERPIIVTVLALIVLGIGIIPVSNMNVSIPTIDSLPESYESRAAYETIHETFMSEYESTTYVIAERDGDWLTNEGLEDMKQLEDRLKEPSVVDSVETLFSVSDFTSSEQLAAALEQPEVKQQLEPAIDQFITGDQLFIPVHLTVADNSSEAHQLMTDWSHTKWDVDVMFGGLPKFNQEIYQEILDNVLLTLLIIIVSTFFILMIAFRSIVIPLKAIAMNVIGLTSTFGILVWLFQGGHFGLEQTNIALILPVIVFSLVFGLSMDYEVFLISRIHEFYRQTGDNTEATAQGLANTSKIITSAALIMIVITGAFAFTNIVPVKQIGIGIAIAIFIDVTIIRLLLVPSLMKLLGDWNWWLPFRSKSKVKHSS
ncbi:MMPL family transporter [Pontibacillus litoralis]|uniref:Membrane protein n=1 Tax=Pontibacillus litoralis JSM 072002 TaxID=1385512 RepID=A0A0A5HVR8_9BACI|nr:MMPL family transporter [Pontibacillus litoralis]KGX87742.1 membrane protein [Pontibacillus litoralis JSM 072002]